MLYEVITTAVICLISSACRVSELIRLDISDIDFKNGKAQVLAKGGKMHTLIFNRITSYNVCYTKLLRDSQFVKNQCMHFPSLC